MPERELPTNNQLLSHMVNECESTEMQARLLFYMIFILFCNRMRMTDCISSQASERESNNGKFLNVYTLRSIEKFDIIKSNPLLGYRFLIFDRYCFHFPCPLL